MGRVSPWVWWAHGSGGFCWLLIAKSPILRGPTCQGVLGLVGKYFGVCVWEGIGEGLTITTSVDFEGKWIILSKI